MGGWVGEAGPFAGGGVHTVTNEELNELRQPYYIDGAAADVVNTTSATSLFLQTIPAGYINADGLLRLRLSGDYLNNTGSNQTLTVGITFGGTNYYGDASGNIATNAARRVWHMELLLQNAAATNAQWISAWMQMGPIGATTGLGDLASVTQAIHSAFGADAAKDTTSAQALQVFVIHSAASASLSIRCKSHLLEVFPG